MKNPFIITITFVCLLAFEIVGKNPDNIHSKIDVLNQTSKTLKNTASLHYTGFAKYTTTRVSFRWPCRLQTKPLMR